MKLLKIPSSQLLLGSLALGHPAGKIQKHHPGDRKPLSEMVSFDVFEK